MTKPRVLISNIMMLNERPRFDAKLKEMGYEPVWATVSQFLDEAACLELVGEIDGWLAGDDQITRQVLEKALPRLKVIAKWGTGIDSIDRVAAADLGVPIRNAPGAFAHAVAEYAIGLILMANRQLGTVDRAIRAGQWPKPRGRELNGSTLGMIGYGAIGRRIGELGAGFGMTVIHHDPFSKESLSVDEIAGQSDVVCIACALTPENRGMINADFLDKMKASALLCNVARGPIVNEADLIAALQSGAIAGAALDVFEQEPLPTSNPLVAMDNVVLGSHNGNNCIGAVEYVHQVTLDNLAAGLA